MNPYLFWQNALMLKFFFRKIVLVNEIVLRQVWFTQGNGWRARNC